MTLNKLRFAHMSQIEVHSSLKRIGFCGIPTVDQQTLKRLHVGHIEKIPFETLDIFSKKQFSLNPLDLHDKIVTRYRGGYCYELNGFFFYLLQGLGFEVSIYDACLYDNQEKLIPFSQHMILIVKLEELWLIDVGYGNGFTSPLLLNHSQPQQQGSRIFRCLHVNGEYIVQELNEGRWKSWYVFKTDSKRIADFEERNCFHQTCEESVFFGKRICMIASGDETIELVGNVLTKKTASKKIIRIVPEEEIFHILKIEFGIDLLRV